MRRATGHALSRGLLIASALTAVLACGGVDDEESPGGLRDLVQSGEGQREGEGAREGEGEAEGRLQATPDTLTVRFDGERIVFGNASGSSRSQGRQTAIGASRFVGENNESITLLMARGDAGLVRCDFNSAVSWNAWPGGAAAVYSSRREGGSCTLELVEYGQVGGRLRGTMDAVLVDAEGRAGDMVGSFDVTRVGDE
jgi:hypothetical protein